MMLIFCKRTLFKYLEQMRRNIFINEYQHKLAEYFKKFSAFDCLVFTQYLTRENNDNY